MFSLFIFEDKIKIKSGKKLRKRGEERKLLAQVTPLLSVGSAYAELSKTGNRKIDFVRSSLSLKGIKRFQNRKKH